MATVLFLFLFYLLPVGVCMHLCEERNRNAAKGAVVGLIGGWVSVLLLWLGLRRRHPQTLMLY